MRLIKAVSISVGLFVLGLVVGAFYLAFREHFPPLIVAWIMAAMGPPLALGCWVIYARWCGTSTRRAACILGVVLAGTHAPADFFVWRLFAPDMIPIAWSSAPGTFFYLSLLSVPVLASSIAHSGADPDLNGN